ncbi:MAG: calcium-translocating P-type ATPase, PMCA-type [Firmicutes bacterium]|nr:calcium-translocating P-type ATPase, PMCA-type [Bacillota bacterium]
MTSGLTDEQVVESRNKFGSNEISKKKSNSFIKLLIESLGDPIIKILLIALAIKIVFLFKNFDWYETIGILIAIFLASFISSISEYGSNKAFDRLQQESQMLKTKVYRNGQLKEIYTNEIVVGDVVKLSSGDKVPADGLILSGNLSLDESFLTGETKEVYKKFDVNNKSNIVYGGSVIYKGEANVKITSVGDKTFMGNISQQMQDKNEESPLKSRLHVLASQISKLGYAGAILASLSYLFIQIIVNNNFDFSLIMQTIKDFHLMMEYFIYSLTLSVTIIIMAVPEGLPMMITLVLSSNMKKMLKDNVLVRKLVGIETSGSLNVLLCDKTGTLTEGKLSVTKLISKDNVTFNHKKDLKKYPRYEKIVHQSLYLNNEATYSNGNIIGGNTTDRAILNFIGEDKNDIAVLKRKEFDSDTKYSYVSTSDGNYYYKGASEVLLDKCQRFLSKLGDVLPLYEVSYIKTLIGKYTSNGYRVLVNAYNDHEGLDNLIFISLIIISDTIRAEAKESINLIQKAGIKVIMITGDAKETAVSIGKELEIVNYDSVILTHEELERLTDDQLANIAPKIAIIARALPQDKSRLVSIYKKQNLIVGMTGDGVNDALALKKSDVGFALGSGCEVAKEASDIVILDNNINSICKAILYGRTIFKSIRKFIIYQLTVNTCALFLSIVGTLIGISTPITIIQMLWLNMIMDTFAGLAFSYEAPLKEYMEEVPKAKDEKIMNKYMLNQIVVNGLYSAILCILFFKVPIISNMFRYSNNNSYLMTAFFALFIFLGILNSFLSRTHRLNFFANLSKNKVFIIITLFIFITQICIIYFGGNLFRTYGLTLKEIFIVLGLSLTILPIDLLRKKYLKSKKIPIGV